MYDSSQTADHHDELKGHDAATEELSAEQQARGSNRLHKPESPAFRQFIAEEWTPREDELPARHPVAEFAAERRRRISAMFPGDRLVLPAGPLKVRSNDTDYRFRPHSAFAHLTGFGADREPDAVLVMEPNGSGHEDVLYFRPRTGRDTEEFYSDATYGELWVGVRPSLEEISAEFGVEARHLDEAHGAVTAACGGAVRVVREADHRYTAWVDDARGASEEHREADDKLAEALSELRLVKDSHEIEQMRLAVGFTADGFEEVVRALPKAVDAERGERVVEVAFFSHARTKGNDLGYDTIAASGNNATTLHWIRNNGPVRQDDLILVDAGVEADSLYTADVTRTLPASGTFSPVQREIYQAVLDAADAAFAAAKPGVRFRDVHNAAMEVIADRLEKWGFLPGSAEESLSAEGQYHRRWMVHGTSHHLGIDVHDCALARKEMYLDAELEPGMVFTIEPGLYFKDEDLRVPQEFRGIGIRLEDDVLVTEDGVENLSGMLPRGVDEIEAWMARLQRDPSASWRD